uniref:Uncharacterized protein n=1 Tax=Romanomermis culicivorax TaxID=13658 RepID=A0A915JXU8_ROMCU
MDEFSPYKSRVKAKGGLEKESNNSSLYHHQHPTLRESAVFPSSSILEQSKSGFPPSSPYNSKHVPDLYADLSNANSQRNLPFVQQQQQSSLAYGQRYYTSATTGRFSDQLRRNMTSSSNIITYSPPVSRRPPVAPRSVGGGRLSQQQHKHSVSLPSTSQDLIFSTKYGGAAVSAGINGTNFYRCGYDDISLPNQAAANKRLMLNKMRQHKHLLRIISSSSLCLGSLEGDALSSSHLEFSLPNFNQSLVGASAYINDCNSSGSVPPADPHIRPSSAIYGQASPRFAQNYP